MEAGRRVCECPAGFTAVVVFGPTTPLVSAVVEATLATHLLLLGTVAEDHLHNSKGGCRKVFDMPAAFTRDRIPVHHKGLPYQVVVNEITVSSQSVHRSTSSGLM